MQINGIKTEIGIIDRPSSDEIDKNKLFDLLCKAHARLSKAECNYFISILGYLILYSDKNEIVENNLVAVWTDQINSAIKIQDKIEEIDNIPKRCFGHKEVGLYPCCIGCNQYNKCVAKVLVHNTPYL